MDVEYTNVTVDDASFENITEEYFVINSTESSSLAESERAYSEYMISELILVGYLTVLSVGVVLNVLLIGALLRVKRNGTLSLILQLSVVDLLSLAVVGFSEMYSTDQQSWMFGSDFCPVFLGLEVATTTTTAYLLVSLNLHALVTTNIVINYERKKLDKPNEQNNDSSDMESSQHSLMSRTETATPSRSINIDYRRRKLTISVILPSMFIWFLAASLSVPQFALSTTVETSDNVFTCTLIDTPDKIVLQLLLFIFRAFIPVVLLLITLFYACLKLHTFPKESCSILLIKCRKLLHLAITLTIAFCCMSLQRLVLGVVCNFMYGNEINFYINGTPPYLDKHSALGVAMAHYLLSTLRPAICFALHGDVRIIIKTFFLSCHGNDDVH